jgi:hypothetical protein
MTTVTVLFAGVAVVDLGSAVAWYARLFNRPPDVPINDNEVMWRCADPAWIYVIADRERAGRSIAALCVEDLERTVAEFERRGIACGPIEIVGNAGRKSVVRDPDGNTLNFIQVASPHGPS